MIESIKGRDKGQWRQLAEKGVVVSAIYYCAHCGNPMNLLKYHILDDGTVDPSVVCPIPVYDLHPPHPSLANVDLRTPTLDCKTCDFHNHIKLIGWKVH